MVRPKRKAILLSFIYIGAMILLLSPLYMYFSHDVEALRKEYPHPVIKENELVEFEIKGTRPKFWVGLDEISKYAKWAIIFSEDWAFYQHEGIDIEQLKVALNEMVDERRFRGASTITQQMVKNVFLSEERTLWRKLHEIILAQKVEKILTKGRILEIYLNVIEYGPGVYGIKSAARHYFKKHPNELTPREGAFLAMMLPSPKRYYTSFQKKKLTIFAKARINTILKKMRMGKILTKEEFEIQKDSRFSWER